MSLKRQCPVCGGGKTEAIRRISISISTEMRKKIKYPDYYDLVSCKKCGMLFANVDLTKEDVDNYYINCNMYDSASDVKRGLYDEGCEIYYHAIEPYITVKSRIIDIGCGNGKFLRFLKDKGYKNICGLDPAESSVHKLEHSGIKGIVGSIYDDISEELAGAFDVVICSGVFEHLLIPDICLKNMMKFMNRNGILYIVVPNAEGFKDYLRDVPNYFNQEHINYFTTKTLDYFCARNGLRRCSPEEECYHIMCPASPEVIISAIYKKDEIADLQLERDDSGEKSAELFFSKIEKKQQQQKKIVKDLLKEGKNLIIWGTGSFASSLVKELPELLERTICFVDNDISRQKSMFWEKEVVSPEKLVHYTDETILICVMMNSSEIEKQIQTMNLANKVLSLC